MASMPIIMVQAPRIGKISQKQAKELEKEELKIKKYHNEQQI